MKLPSVILLATLPILMLGCPEPESAGGAPPSGAPQVPAGTAPGTQDGAGSPGQPPPASPGEIPAGQTPAGEIPVGEAAPNAKVAEGVHPCGDGECDDVETQNPKLCPRDCGAEVPAGGDWCGDGICDALEGERGLCAKDCTE